MGVPLNSVKGVKYALAGVNAESGLGDRSPAMSATDSSGESEDCEDDASSWGVRRLVVDPDAERTNTIQRIHVLNSPFG